MKPDKVYLQLYSEDGDRLDPTRNEVTWCADRVNDTDVEYLLAHADEETKLTYITDPALEDNILELKELCREIGAVEFQVVREVQHAWFTAEYHGYEDIDTRRMRPAGLIFVARFTATDGGPVGFEIEQVENGEEVMSLVRGNRVRGPVHPRHRDA